MDITEKLDKLKELRVLVEGLGGWGFVDQDADVAAALSILDDILLPEDTPEDVARNARMVELLTWRDEPKGLTKELADELEALEEWNINRF